MDNPRQIGLYIEKARAFGRGICRGVIDYAQENGFTIRFLTTADLQKGRLSDCDGFIARITDDKIARRLLATGKPVVDVYYAKPRPRIAIVKTRHESIGRLAAEHFIDRHFNNFAYCPFGAGRTSIYCRQAFARRLKRDGFNCVVYGSDNEPTYQLNDLEIINDDIRPPRDAKRLLNWLKTLPKPVAVFCPSDLRAWQIVHLCRSANIDVPSEIAVLGLDNDVLLCGISRPMLSSIDPDAHMIGWRSAELIDRQLAHGIPSKQVIVQIEPKGIVARTSTENYPLDPPWLSDALIYINREAKNRISAQDVFQKLGLSHTSVVRAFRSALGTTVQQVIQATRLKESERLLSETSLGLEEIGRRAGFASTTYFMQCFTKAHGISPGSWRKELEVKKVKSKGSETLDKVGRTIRRVHPSHTLLPISTSPHAPERLSEAK